MQNHITGDESGVHHTKEVRCVCDERKSESENAAFLSTSAAERTLRLLRKPDQDQDQDQEREHAHKKASVSAGTNANASR